MLRSTLLLAVLSLTSALPIPHNPRDLHHHEHHRHEHRDIQHYRRDLGHGDLHKRDVVDEVERDVAPVPMPELYKRLPVPQGGSFHNETHWWVPDTVHHGLIEADSADRQPQPSDNTDVGGRRVQMHVVAGRAKTSWA